MTSPHTAPQTPPPPREAPVRRRARSSLLAQGEPSIWATGGAVVVALTMIVGLLVLIIYQGGATFWPGDVVQLRVLEMDSEGKPGERVYLGEITRTESYTLDTEFHQQLPQSLKDSVRAESDKEGSKVRRRLLRTVIFNADGTESNLRYHWINDFSVLEETQPEWAIVLEREDEQQLTEKTEARQKDKKEKQKITGRFYGLPTAFLLDGEVVASDPADVWARFTEYHEEVRERHQKRIGLEKDGLGEISRKLEKARLGVRKAEIDHGKGSPQYSAAVEKYQAVQTSTRQEEARIKEEIAGLNTENLRYQLQLKTADGQQEKNFQLASIVRAYRANQLTTLGKFGVYFSRWKEFLFAGPRSANTEGGVFPAIWGTVAMTLIMSILVVPFGVLAALYLREYAKSGPIISAVRIAINNLAGVPSIVFGVFGLGFFCYIIGASVDQVFFYEKLPNPTYGTGGLFWASLTLALLTLPVVIVSTEEALAAVPSSMREGSYACGASKWQTIWRIVLPRAMPGIMTGMILAMARGAGEVAPLMLVGAVKYVPELPVDGVFPYVHPERSFMHLGFHIFDVGFQSPDSEAARPMVFTTTLLLIAIIAVLNIMAIWMRSRLRRRYQVSQF